MTSNVPGDTPRDVQSGLRSLSTYNVSVAAFTVGAGPSAYESKTTGVYLYINMCVVLHQ